MGREEQLKVYIDLFNYLKSLQTPQKEVKNELQH